MAAQSTRREQSGRPRSISTAKLDAMVAEAIVDCHNESKRATGLFTMLEDNLAVPFETSILGVTVVVERVDLNTKNQIVAICRHDQVRQAISTVDLPLPTPGPEGSEWRAGHRHWLGGE